MAIYHPEYRDAYFPGTEELGPNEIRMTALRPEPNTSSYR